MEETIEDRTNGLFEGWVMAADITDRDYSTKLHYNLISITPMHFEFRGSLKVAPYLKFKTAHLHYVCE
jgi:hypothetical protein